MATRRVLARPAQRASRVQQPRRHPPAAADRDSARRDARERTGPRKAAGRAFAGPRIRLGHARLADGRVCGIRERRDAAAADADPPRRRRRAVMSCSRRTTSRSSVLSETTAFLMSDMLTDVINAGTASKARSLGFTLPAAGKTGTTNSFNDAWFVGYTPQARGWRLGGIRYAAHDRPQCVCGLRGRADVDALHDGGHARRLRRSGSRLRPAWSRRRFVRCQESWRPRTAKRQRPPLLCRRHAAHRILRHPSAQLLPAHSGLERRAGAAAAAAVSRERVGAGSGRRRQRATPPIRRRPLQATLPQSLP